MNEIFLRAPLPHRPRTPTTRSTRRTNTSTTNRGRRGLEWETELSSLLCGAKSWYLLELSLPIGRGDEHYLDLVLMAVAIDLNDDRMSVADAMCVIETIGLRECSRGEHEVIEDIDDDAHRDAMRIPRCCGVARFVTSSAVVIRSDDRSGEGMKRRASVTVTIGGAISVAVGVVVGVSAS
jgi:hypothetical protein